LIKTIQVNNVRAIGCEAQLTWKCLFMSTFFSGQFCPVK